MRFSLAALIAACLVGAIVLGLNAVPRISTEELPLKLEAEGVYQIHFGWPWTAGRRYAYDGGSSNVVIEDAGRAVLIRRNGTEYRTGYSAPAGEYVGDIWGQNIGVALILIILSAVLTEIVVRHYSVATLSMATMDKDQRDEAKLQQTEELKR